jgi:hypothetical protein
MDEEIKYLQKHNQQKVIDEDTWEKSIEKIIQRDFYPNGPMLEAQMNFFEALESKDPSRIENAHKELEKHKKPKEKTDKKNLGLDEFFSKYTSEDTASFSLILEKLRQKQRQKMKDYYNGKEIEQKNEIKLLTNSTQIPLIGSSVSHKQIQKNSLYYYEEGVSQSQPLNDKLPKKEINYENVTFFEAKLPDLSEIKKPKKDTVWNTTYGSEDIPTKNNDGSTPLVNGYKMISTPSLDSIDNSVSELMSWGTVVDSIEISDGPKFKIPEVSKREKTAIQLLEKSTTSKIPNFSIAKNSPAMKLKNKKKIGTESGFAGSLRSSYTPSPSINSFQGTKTPKSELIKPIQSPQIQPSTKKRKIEKRNEGSEESITDDLLNL